MSDRPTVDEFLGPRAAYENTPVSPPEQTVDQFLGPRSVYEHKSLGGSIYDFLFSQPEHDLDKFKMGFRNGWGTRPLGQIDPEAEAWMKERGLLDAHKEGTDAATRTLREFNETVIRPAYMAADLLLRGPYSVARGMAEMSGFVGAVGGAASAGMEASPEGGLLRLAPHPPAMSQALRTAHELGITDERYPGMSPNETARQAFAPSQEHPPTQEVISPAMPEEPTTLTPATDINEAARRLAPEAFQEYDALLHQRNTLNSIKESLEESPAELQSVIAATDKRLLEVSPEIAGAYRDARAAMPELQAALEPVSESVMTPAAAAAEPPNVLNLLQRRPTIAAEVARDLQAAGRPAEEARYAGALQQAHYEARAARFQGALGSARELYDRDAPTIEGAEGSQRGALTLSTNTIRLMQSADASTFLHEMAHGWFEELLKDAQHPLAPADLIADVNAVKAWLQMKGDRPTRANHELIARGFERYMMEGVAPTARLAGVFAKFRDWLTSIYQTVARLRAPISDEIRGVYDRLLATPRDETVVAPERNVSANFADVHEADLAAISRGERATSATPEDILKLANEQAAERDRVAAMLRPEIENARRRARAARTGGGTKPGGTPPIDETGTSVPESGDNGRMAVADGENPLEKPAEVSPSGATFKAESNVPVGPNEPFAASGETRLRSKSGEFKLESLDSPQDVDQAIRDATTYNKDSVGDQKGSATQAQLLDLADSLGMDISQLEVNRIGQAYTAEEIASAQRLILQSSADVRARMIEASESGNPLELAKAITRLEMIMGKIKQSTSEWGHAGRALRELNKTLDTNADLNTLLQRNTGRSYDELLQMAAQGKNLPTPRQLNQLVKNTTPTMGPIGRAVTWWAINAWLSGLYTHVGYVIGNNLRVLLQPVEAGISGAVGAVRTLGGTGDRAYMREAGAGFESLARGAWDGVRPALEAYHAGHQIPLPGDTTTSNPWGGNSPFGPAVTTAFGQPLKFVAGIHQMGRVQFYTQALYELTMRQGLDEGLSGDALAQRVADLRTNPTADMTARARDVADTSMFQRKTQFGTYQAGLARWTDSHVMAKLMFPFTKIAFEQIRESIVKRTPLAFGSQEMRNQLLMRGSGAAFDEAWGKVIFGTGLLGGGLLWAASGGITGAGPTDPKKRSEWLLNNQPNSMTIGNLQVPIAGLGYPSKLLQLAADLWETREFTKDDDLGKAAVAYMQATLRTVLDEGFFRDVANLNDAIHDPGRNAPRYLNSIALGAIPYSSFLGQANRHILDPYSKEVEPGLAGMFQDLRARMPVTSWDIPNRPDMFGEPIPSRGVNFNRYAGDPTAQWLAQIGVGPGRLDRSMAGGVRLTEDQFHNLEQRSGQLSKQLLDAMRDSTRQLPLGMQLKMIDSLIGTARHSARIELGIQSVGSDNDIWAKAQELKLRKFQ